MVAGAFVLISLALSQLHSPYWLLFTALVGLNLLQSAFTLHKLVPDDACPAEVRSPLKFPWSSGTPRRPLPLFFRAPG
jgi:hypothetical protein